MALLSANSLSAVFDCFLYLKDNISIALFADLRVIAALNDILYGLFGFIVNQIIYYPF